MKELIMVQRANKHGMKEFMEDMTPEKMTPSPLTRNLVPIDRNNLTSEMRRKW